MTRLAEELADELARDVIEYTRATNDFDLERDVIKTLEDQSQTLQEAFITSLRVQRAALRARSMIDRKRKAAAEAAAAEAAAAPPG